MAGKFHHEELYRGADLAQKLAATRVTLCGAGALGSNLADTLARQGLRNLRVIDRDRIEEHNVSTQIYGEGDVGAWKVDVLRSQLFRSTSIEIEAINKELSERTAAKYLKDSDFVLETFDNSASRRLVSEYCLHSKVACARGAICRLWRSHLERVLQSAWRC
jgi:molybdopterin/thiamine biosynthesis adenylyltransferase